MAVKYEEIAKREPRPYEVTCDNCDGDIEVILGKHQGVDLTIKDVDGDCTVNLCDDCLGKFFVTFPKLLLVVLRGYFKAPQNHPAQDA